MLLQISVITAWILITTVFYLAVALVCRRMRYSRFMAAAYATVRSTISGKQGWRWYAFLFFGTIVGITLALRLGIVLSSMTEAWQAGIVVLACAAVWYSAMMFWPDWTGKSSAFAVLFRAFGFGMAIGCAGLYLYCLMHWPGWLMRAIGTYAMAIPPLVLFRSVKIRTAVCLLIAATVYDAFHVYVTGWMQIFMHQIRDTSLVMQIPNSFEWNAPVYFTIAHGDFLAPGMLVVVAARVPDGRSAVFLTSGTSIGVAIGFALSTLVTFWLNSIPALVVLVPCACLGYITGFLLARFTAKPV